MERRQPDTERTLPDGADTAAQPARTPLRERKGLLASAVILIALFGLGVALAHPFASSPARSGVAVPTSTTLPPAPPFGLAQTPQPTSAVTQPGPAATDTPDAGDGSDATPTENPSQHTLPAYLLVHPKQQNPAQPCASGDWPPIMLTNAGGQSLDWSATTSTGAVSLDTSSGTLGANESLTVNLQGQLTNTTHPFVHVYFHWDGGLITATVYCTA